MARHGKDLTAAGPVILALETSGSCGSIALVTEQECIGEYTLQSKLTHSRRLLVGVEWLMQEAGLGWPEVRGIAVSLGPGSFTGLRIGLSTAKGLVMATGASLLGVSALEGLAGQFAFAPQLICPVLDARKKEVYACLYRLRPGGWPEEVSGAMVLPPETLASMINEPVVLVGDGAAVYEELFRRRLGELALFAPRQVYLPRAASIGRLAMHKWQQGQFLDPASAVPLYIRPSEAEINYCGTFQAG